MSAGQAPRDAATVVLLREGAASGGGFEVLMVRRPRGAAFMADAFVFPGGRVDDADSASHPTVGDAQVTGDARLAAIAADEARAVTCCVAAIREMFEEAGVLLAVDRAGAAPRTDDDPWFAEARAALRAGTRGLRELLAERELALSVGELAFFARWITPASEPRRFDARFYLARMPAGQTARFDADELYEQRWATPRALLDDHARGAIKLPPPTQWHLADLARMRTIDEAFAWARAHEVAPVRPKLVPAGDTLAIVLPWDPEYASLPGEGAVIERTHPVAGPISRFVLVDGRWAGSEQR